MSVAVVSLLTIACDQAVKFFITNFFPFLVFYNSGIAFGLLSAQDAGVILVLSLSFLIVVFFLNCFLAFNKYSSGNIVDIVAWGLFIGGAVSNLLDRFFYGAIVDFIVFNSFYTFNLADFALVFGIVIISTRMLK